MKRSKLITIWLGLFLAAAAMGAPDIELIPVEYDFGVMELGDTDSTVIEIKNAGDGVLRLDDIALTDDSSSDFQITTVFYLPVFFGAGGSFFVEVSYTPTEVGKAEATLAITSSDPDEALVEVALKGEVPADGVSPEEQIAAIIEFFDQAVKSGELKGIPPHGLRKKHFESYWTNYRLRGYRQRLLIVQRFIERGWYDWARWHVSILYSQIDGRRWPSDLIRGPATTELGEMLLELQKTLGDMSSEGGCKKKCRW